MPALHSTPAARPHLRRGSVLRALLLGARVAGVAIRRDVAEGSSAGLGVASIRGRKVSVAGVRGLCWAKVVVCGERRGGRGGRHSGSDSLPKAATSETPRDGDVGHPLIFVVTCRGAMACWPHRTQSCMPSRCARETGLTLRYRDKVSMRVSSYLNNKVSLNRDGRRVAAVTHRQQRKACQCHTHGREGRNRHPFAAWLSPTVKR